ncbi:hypothetical protein [Sphingomonas sp. BAUL-RG-20F-R05-02]|uniref:hypothetical protein n=1 Tax=Sphingomonas sp. BAUL-RG-20F-R05-02 TaxID=2914830 RepID=UPI001F59259B|nr:hypothetical protein [Sphingomonas sp. BAUL-RG-20F-R05-02]
MTNDLFTHSPKLQKEMLDAQRPSAADLRATVGDASRKIADANLAMTAWVRVWNVWL